MKDLASVLLLPCVVITLPALVAATESSAAASNDLTLCYFKICPYPQPLPTVDPQDQMTNDGNFSIPTGEIMESLKYISTKSNDKKKLKKYLAKVALESIKIRRKMQKDLDLYG